MTALARALSYDSRVLILDEPTAALTDAETSSLFHAMRQLQDRGVAILYVSHRLDEVLEISDTYTVLRNGRIVAEGLIADATPEAIITAMAGRPIDAIFPPRDVRARRRRARGARPPRSAGPRRRLRGARRRGRRHRRTGRLGTQ